MPELHITREFVDSPRLLLAPQLLIPRTSLVVCQPMKECVLVKEAPYGTVLVKTGTHSFSTKLVESGLISRHDVAVAEQHALREQLHLVDAVVILGFVREHDSYAALSASLAASRASFVTCDMVTTPSFRGECTFVGAPVHALAYDVPII